jgi:hypothetical protein
MTATVPAHLGTSIPHKRPLASLDTHLFATHPFPRGAQSCSLLCTSKVYSQFGPLPLRRSSHCGHCLHDARVSLYFSLRQSSPVQPCPALPCTRVPLSSKIQCSLCTSDLTPPASSTACNTPATDCLTVAHPVPSLYARMEHQRQGKAGLYLAWSPALLRPALGFVDHNEVQWLWGVGTVPSARAWVHGPSVHHLVSNPSFFPTLLRRTLLASLATWGQVRFTHVYPPCPVPVRL